MNLLKLMSSIMTLQNVPDWLLGKMFAWPPQPPINKVDTHHHWVPPLYAKAVSDAGGDPSGWATPSWSQHSAEVLMGHVGIKTAILSITAPGACIVKDEKASWELARQLNEQAAAIRDSDPSKFGFFAALADIHDTKAALDEIAYAMDTLGADGVTLFTRYGTGSNYLGHAAFQPIWKELDRREAVVFVHPTHPQDTEKINDYLPQPVVDYPHETTRTAMDMLVAGVPQKYSKCKVILSHAGGSLPYVIGRVATPLSITNPQVSKLSMGLSYDSIMNGFRWFYYDLALSSTTIVLNNLLSQLPHDHILYGSDFPYAPPPAYPAFLAELEKHDMTADQRDAINFGNAFALFPRLAQYTKAKF